MSAAPQHVTWRIRSMEEGDVRAVAALEQASYEFPWTEGIFRDCLRMGYLCQVAERMGQVVAYYVVTVGVHEGHLLNLCVGEEARGLGLGRQLLLHALERAAEEEAETVFLEVRPTNTAAIALYESEGFVEIGRRKDYYRASQGREDALILARSCL